MYRAFLRVSASRRPRVASVLAVLTLLFSKAHAQEPSTLQQKLQDALRASDVDPADLGVCVWSIDRGAELFAHAADRPRELASNQKLLTTAAALARLGPEHRFVTVLWRGADLSAKGTLRGPLVVQGDGDPNVSGRFHEGNPRAVFEAWARALKDAGVARIEGDLVLDATAFDAVLRHPDWPADSAGAWYGAPVAALSLNDNCVDFTVRAGAAAGERVRIELSPATAAVEVVNGCVTVADARDHVLAFVRAPAGEKVTVKGKFWARRDPWVESVPVGDPVRFYGAALGETLVQAGIEFAGKVVVADARRDAAAEALVEVARRESTLARTIQVANKRSQNFYAEAILKHLGWVRAKKGTWEAGAAEVRDFLKEIGAPEGAEIADGSGLSRKNRWTPAGVVFLLRHMAGSEHGRTFADSLAVAGVDGSLEKRMTEAPWRGKVFAKTGTMSGTSSLSGYLDRPGGERLAFSILCDKLEKGTASARKLQERILKLLLEP